MLERDTQRGELNKVKQGQAEVSYDMEGTREEIHKLTQQINLAEQQLNKVRMWGTFELQRHHISRPILAANIQHSNYACILCPFAAYMHDDQKLESILYQRVWNS